MDTQTLINLFLVLAFVVVGGVFAGTEIALVSLREGQISALSERGPRGARVARVARDPNRFLAAVQIGVTVAGFFSAAYGASTLAPDFAPVLENAGLSETAADTASLILLTLLIAYLSLVLGELVPKRLALQRAVGVAYVTGGPLDRFAVLMRPVVWLLSISTNGIVRLFGGDPSATSEELSDEELRFLVDQHEGLADDERKILTDVFDAGDRSLSEVMRPRRDVAFLAVECTVAQAVEAALSHPYSRFPVIGTSQDDVLGFLHVRDLLGADPQRRIRGLTREILHLPATNRLLPSLARMRDEGRHIAVVVDEYGGTDGIVTLEDLVEELVGDIRDEYDEADPVTAPDVVDARLTIEEFARLTGVPLDDGPYETVAGYVMHALGRLAEVGDTVLVGEHQLVVTEVDRHRITQVSVRLLAGSSETPPPEDPRP
ncbi:hemolysin family protein [Nocardioides hankookensis]|uniref:Hemolysin family protein n=1 Tax=Nocardioides hankookensis TaxID=443157 RepID=A0ABW1LNB1_9ACTN